MSAQARTWTLDLSRDVAPLTPNRRRHWRYYQTAVKEWRQVARLACFEARIPQLARVDLFLEVTPPDRRRRDDDNLVPYLLKPCKDGVVDAGIVPDDTAEFVSWRVRLAPFDGVKRWRYRLTIREVLFEDVDAA